RIVVVCDRVAVRRSVIGVIIAGELTVMTQFVLWRRAFWAGFSGPLPRLAELSDANAAVLLALAAALVAVAAVARWGRLEAAVLLVAGLGMGYGILRDVDLVFWSNLEQVAAIEAVNRQIPPDRR